MEDRDGELPSVSYRNGAVRSGAQQGGPAVELHPLGISIANAATFLAARLSHVVVGGGSHSAHWDRCFACSRYSPSRPTTHAPAITNNWILLIQGMDEEVGM